MTAHVEPQTRSGGRAAAHWRSVALPSEHGGWSLTAEPALLGLLVAWSWPGLALGLGAMIAFVTRTPLKLVLVDRWRGRWLPRTKLALVIASVEIVVLCALAAFAIGAASSPFWLPLVVAAPLIVTELWFDMRSRSRRLIPELAGAIGIGAIATAIALAGGETETVAWGLWVVMAARSLAAIPYVRTQILRAKSRPAPKRHSDVAQLASVVAVGAAWLADIVPAGAAIVVAVFAAFNVAALRSRPRRAVVIGIQQTIVGLAVVVVTAIAVLAQ